jgi:hypothetical protein
VRLVRLIRIVKLYKNAHNAMAKKEEDEDGDIDLEMEKNVQEEEIKPDESKVGKKLSDLTTRRVIILVLSMMFSIPFLSLDTYKSEDTFTFGLELINAYPKYSAGFNRTFDTYVSEHKDLWTPLITVQAYDKSWIKDNFKLSSLRSNDYDLAAAGEDNALAALFDIRPNNKIDAGLSLLRTVFICFVLAGGALFFSRDTQMLVIGPIEQMVDKVKKIAKNPLEAAQEEEQEALSYENKNAKKKKKKKNAPYETVILEQTIVKIGALLALGFGEAGARIINANMGSTGDIDPMVPGTKVVGIFGFCDIRQFTDTTEILQEDVMIFVNEIAEIVHRIVDSFLGAANKNIGDAFLVVWKYPEDNCHKDPETKYLTVKKTMANKQRADMSLVSFLKILSEIKQSAKLEKYKENEMLNERMPNYCVKLGFGLHIGWAIEGAIGSDFKIDASYLSPNVNMASTLEAATK